MGVAMCISKQLRFYVTQRGHVLFQVHITVAKSAARLVRDTMEQLHKLIRRLDHLNAFTAATVHGLDQHRDSRFLQPPRPPAQGWSRCRGCQEQLARLSGVLY